MVRVPVRMWWNSLTARLGVAASVAGMGAEGGPYPRPAGAASRHGPAHNLHMSHTSRSRARL